jgi:hypothetical protein
VGFYIGNKIWPNFYFEPVQAEERVASRAGLHILVYFVGVCYAVAGVRRTAGQRR